MNLFDKLVDEALRSSSAPTNLRLVVEKEILHHDILRELSKANLLAGLTFMGGTCLRACYGAKRLSEGLDFTGGKDFSKGDLLNLSKTIIYRLKSKYGLTVKVSEPKRERGNTSTWKIRIETRPERPDLPAQKINIDICSVPSYQKSPRALINHYDIDLGTEGLLIQCESREEIFVNKIIAFALRPNRIKNRDLWDIAWLHQQGIRPALELCHRKVDDHQYNKDDFIARLDARIVELETSPDLERPFMEEMNRFLPMSLAESTLRQDGFWQYITTQTVEASRSAIKVLQGQQASEQNFNMS